MILEISTRLYKLLEQVLFTKKESHCVFIYLYCLKLQLICTVTPSSSNSEETHNTLKFAHRAKHIEIQAAQNKVYSFKLSAL